MATRTIFSDIFRLSYPWLKEPQPSQKPDEPAKFGFSMMFPKTGICPINNQPTSFTSIQQALTEVCQEQWNLTFEQATAEGMGIQFPPKWKDGDMMWQKDANGNPLHGQVNPASAGMWIMSCKNAERIGCVDPTGTKDIDPSALYGGCWARAQLEISAYDIDRNNTKVRILVVKALNIQMAYDDESFGSKPQHQVGAAAFAGQAITDTNVAAGVGQGGSMTPVAPAPTAPAPTAPAPTAPAPTAPAPTAPAPTAPAPTAPAPTAPAPTAPAPSATSDPVVMNAGEASYAEYVAQGWTAEMLIQHGKAKPNYLAPAQ